MRIARLRRALVIPQNADFVAGFRVTRGGVPVDWTGWTGKWQIRSKHASDTVILSGDESNGLEFGTDGRFTLRAPATATAALTAPQSGVIDVRLVDPDGAVFRQIEGPVFVSPCVTREPTP